MFISDKFYLDGIHSDEMGISLITLDSNVINDYGFRFDKSVSKELNSSTGSIFVNDNDNIDPIVLNMCPSGLCWDEFSLDDIYNWILKDRFMPFISEDDIELIYYLKPIKIVKKLSFMMQGYLEVTFQPLSNHAYKKDVKKLSISTPKEIKINNVSNCFDEYCYPIITIDNLGDENSVIEISNTSIEEESMIITGLLHRETIVIDNGMYTVLNKNNDNKILNCNRKWIKLKKGYNTLSLSGNCNVTINSEFPFYR